METVIIILALLLALALFFSFIIALAHIAFGDRDDPRTPNSHYYKD